MEKNICKKAENRQDDTTFLRKDHDPGEYVMCDGLNGHGTDHHVNGQLYGSPQWDTDGHFGNEQQCSRFALEQFSIAYDGTGGDHTPYGNQYVFI